MIVNPSTDLTLAVNGTEVEQVKSFTYLGSKVTVDGGALEVIYSLMKRQMGYMCSCTKF
jgi:hypothetical protein